MEKRVKIESELSNYIEGLFLRDNYLRSLLFLLLSNEDTKEEDLDYYFHKTLLTTIELELAKHSLNNEYSPGISYSKFYMDFENKEIVFIAEDHKS